jgi:hypothetical protein
MLNTSLSGCGLFIHHHGSGGTNSVLASGEVNPRSVAVDATNVYWTDFAVNGSAGAESGPQAFSGSIVTVPLGGGTPTTLQTGRDKPLQIAVDDTFVYWAEGGTDLIAMPKGGGAPVTVSSIEEYGIVTDSNHVYWTTGPDVMQGAGSGGGQVQLAGGQAGGNGIACDGTNVYWVTTMGTPNQVVSVPIAGGTITTLATTAPGGSIAVNSTTVFWTVAGAVLSVPIAGGAVTTIASARTTPDDVPDTLVADDDWVYWSTVYGQDFGIKVGYLYKAPAGGGSVTTLSSGTLPSGLALDSNNLYWVDTNGSINVLPR